MDMQKLDLLREALPYINRFKGKTLVVKLSGKITDDEQVLLSMSEEIALCHQVGFRMVVVHGGGKQLTELAEKLGIQQNIVNGRRVTCSDTLEVAKMVFAGKVRTDILSVLRGHGVRTVGLSGLDGNIIRARRREIQKIINRETGQEQVVDFGHVGDIVEIDTSLLRLLLSEGYVPVIASLGADDLGNTYNINADTIATEIAVHLSAEKLVLMSNVDGVYVEEDGTRRKLTTLTLSEAEELLDSHQVSDGMIPKLSSVISLLQRGGKAAHVISGFRRNALLQEIFTDRGSGTMITGELKSSEPGVDKH
jgi:acetylglutamate kinase